MVIKKKNLKGNYVWYAAYGSNLLRERFLCYISGGRPVGARRTYDGCADKTLPVADEKITIKRRLYFAKESMNWENMAVSFITQKAYPDEKTLGRMYLITQGQFLDVLRQENNYKGSIEINTNEAIKKGFWKFTEWSWYNKMIYLGTRSGYPIFTFTHSLVFRPYNKPGSLYLKAIFDGIKQTYGFKSETMVDYLLSKSGIRRKYKRAELVKLFSSTQT